MSQSQEGNLSLYYGCTIVPSVLSCIAALFMTIALRKPNRMRADVGYAAARRRILLGLSLHDCMSGFGYAMYWGLRAGSSLYRSDVSKFSVVPWWYRIFFMLAIYGTFASSLWTLCLSLHISIMVRQGFEREKRAVQWYMWCVPAASMVMLVLLCCAIVWPVGDGELTSLGDTLWLAFFVLVYTCMLVFTVLPFATNESGALCDPDSENNNPRTMLAEVRRQQQKLARYVLAFVLFSGPGAVVFLIKALHGSVSVTTQGVAFGILNLLGVVNASMWSCNRSCIVATVAQLVPSQKEGDNDRFYDFAEMENRSDIVLVQTPYEAMDDEHGVRVEAGTGAEAGARIQQAWLIQGSKIRVGTKIGTGTSATVHMATYMGEPVAVKALNSDILDSESQGEVEMLSQLHHPNIVRFYGICMERRYIVMEYVPHTLHDLVFAHRKPIKTGAPAPPVHRLCDCEGRVDIGLYFRLALQLARVMYFIHGRGVIHRDLKLTNVLVTADNQIKLADFGISKLVDTDNMLKTMTIQAGTPSFMAPEVMGAIGNESFQSARYDHRVDIYAYGIMLWMMWHAKDPFCEIKGGLLDFMMAVAQHRYRPPLEADCPRILCDLMQRCWHHDPFQRPESFADIVSELEEAAQDLSLHEVPQAGESES